MKKVLLVFSLVCMSMWVFGEPETQDEPGVTIDIGAGQVLSTNAIYSRFTYDMLLSVPPATVVGSFSLQNDGKYGEPVPGFWGGVNATLNEGGIRIGTLPFSARIGRFYHSDLVDSPYSLFISAARIPAIQAELRVDMGSLFVVSRWIELNRDSAPELGYPDRGATFKTIGMEFGDLRVAIQDSAVYTGRTFDLEYFLSPLPGIAVQYVRAGTEGPARQLGNDNNLMGFFVDYRPDDFYVYGQLLLDDVNMNVVLNPSGPQNPDKIAWSLGGHYDSPFGRFGLYHAGATKYTFQAFGGGSSGSATDTKYGYSYFPATEYTVGGEPRVIFPEENYIGYLHGENNIAFLLSYDPQLQPVTLQTELELMISGAKSPANPWHELNTWSEGGQGTKFLDGDRLETKIMSRTRSAATFGRWSFAAELDFGVTINALELTAVPLALAGTNNEIRYFSPGTSTIWHAGIDLTASVRLGPMPGRL